VIKAPLSSPLFQLTFPHFETIGSEIWQFCVVVSKLRIMVKID